MLTVNLEYPPGRPSVNRGIGVGKVPLVSRELAVGMEIPDIEKFEQLMLGEVRIDQGKDDCMKSQIPRRKPGILPLVWHGKDGAAVDMLPVCVAAILTISRRRRRAGIVHQSEADILGVILFAPDHSGERLPVPKACVRVVHAGLNSCVEFIALANSAPCD